MSTPREYWNARAESYDSYVTGLYAAAYDKTVARSLPYLGPGDRMLEFACGTGVVTLPLAPHVGSLIAIDISDAMIRTAREKAGGAHPNLALETADVFSPEFVPQSFDVAAAYNVLLYLENADAVLARLRALLRPGGVFLSVTDCLGWPPTADALKRFGRVLRREIPHVSFFTPRSLVRRIEAAGFEVLEQENLYGSPPNLFVAARRVERSGC